MTARRPRSRRRAAAAERRPAAPRDEAGRPERPRCAPAEQPRPRAAPRRAAARAPRRDAEAPAPSQRGRVRAPRAAEPPPERRRQRTALAAAAARRPARVERRILLTTTCCCSLRPRHGLQRLDRQGLLLVRLELVHDRAPGVLRRAGRDRHGGARSRRLRRLAARSPCRSGSSPCFSLLVVLVPGIGTEVNGARRWIIVAGFSYSPSELAKLACICLVAGLVDQSGRPTCSPPAASCASSPSASGRPPC